MPPDLTAEHSATPPSRDDERGTFALFTLDGNRYRSEGMPVDGVLELDAYAKAILELARAEWLAENPDRRRVPAGFYENFDLRLIWIRPGSARLGLHLRRPSNIDDAEWDPLERAYEAGRDLVTEAVHSVADGSDLPRGITRPAVAAVKRIGSTLRDDERLTIGQPVDRGQRRVEINSRVRRVLAEIDDALPTPARVTLRGVITEYDGRRRSFQIDTDTGLHTGVLAPGDEALARMASRLVAHDGILGPDVTVEGETDDPTSRRISLRDVDSIQIERTLAEKTIMSRLDRLRDLQPDWNGPDSLPPAADALEHAEDLIDALAQLNLPMAVAPTNDGGITIEFRRGPWELTVQLEADGDMFLCLDNVETDDLEEAEGPYDRDRVIDFMRTGRLS
jgi:hypothetical protein